MYKWAVTIYLKSGAVLKGVAECEHDTSNDVFEAFMKTKGGVHSFTSIFTEDRNGAFVFAVDDVSAMELRPLGED